MGANYDSYGSGIPYQTWVDTLALPGAPGRQNGQAQAAWVREHMGAQEAPGGPPVQEAVSNAGLPTWGSSYVQGVLGEYGPYSMQNYRSSLENLRNAPKFIEDQRVAQNSQWLRDLQGPTNATLKSGINHLAGRGMVNSSVSGDWLQRIAQQMLQSTARQQTESNVWASGMKYKNLTDMVTASQGLAALLGDYLGLARVSSSRTPVFWPGTMTG